MIILHSWGGCRKLLLRGSSCLAQNQRSSQGSHVHLARLSAGSSIIFPWLRQELLSPPRIKTGTCRCPGDAACPPMQQERREALAWAAPGLLSSQAGEPCCKRLFFPLA